jgi:precorrin-6Y C5,15-methyltransferase (decarboxylating)
MPDAVFIGGSGRRMESIVAAILDANPKARLVISAITLETLSETLAIIRQYDLQNADIQQIAVSQARAVGGLHMMTAQNPVYVISADGKG